MNWRSRLSVWWALKHQDDRIAIAMLTTVIALSAAMYLTFGVFQVGVAPRGEDGKLLLPEEMCACP